jgi:hypothetical protein
VLDLFVEFDAVVAHGHSRHPNGINRKNRDLFDRLRWAAADPEMIATGGSGRRPEKHNAA